MKTTIINFIKKYYGYIVYSIAIVILCYMLFNRCGGQKEITEPTKVTTKVFIPGKTIGVPIYQPYKVIAPPDTFWREVDSNRIRAEYPKLMTVLEDCAQVTQDYYSKKVYSRTLIDDSNFVAYLQDTTYKNSIQQGKFYIELKKAITTNNYTNYPKPCTKLYIGLNVGVDLASYKPYVGISALLMSKGAFGYEVRFNTLKQVDFGVHYKLSFKKK